MALGLRRRAISLQDAALLEMRVDRVRPSAAAILKHPDFLGILGRVGENRVLIPELSVDVPLSVASPELENPGLQLFRLGQQQIEVRVGQFAQLIPTALSTDCSGPGATGDGGETLGHVHQRVPSIAAGIHDSLVAVPNAVAEEIGA